MDDQTDGKMRIRKDRRKEDGLVDGKIEGRTD